MYLSQHTGVAYSRHAGQGSEECNSPLPLNGPPPKGPQPLDAAVGNHDELDVRKGSLVGGAGQLVLGVGPHLGRGDDLLPGGVLVAGLALALP